MLIGALSGGFFVSNNNAPAANTPSPDLAAATASGIESGAVINNNASISSAGASTYGYLALADLSNGSLISLSSPSGKTFAAEATANYAAGASTSSILQAIAFKFNVPLRALQSLASNGQ